jgi:citrate lyase gamma subunit
MKAILSCVAALGIAGAIVAMAPNSDSANSGLKPGEKITPFHPEHLSGPLAGTTNCFPCTFKAAPQVQVWVHGDTVENAVGIAKSLETAAGHHKTDGVKGMVVFVAPAGKTDETKAMAKEVIAQSGVKEIAVAVIDAGHKAVEAYKINLGKDVRNTVIAYKDWTVVKTDVNVEAKGQTECGALCAAVEAAVAGK